MLRSIAGMIVGYGVLFVFFLAIFTGAYLVLSVDYVFQPDSYEVTPLWLVLSAIISLGGSVLAGYVCAAISKSKQTCELLAVIVFLILILFCIPKMRDRTPHIRAGEVSTMDAMRRTQMPVWMYVLNPFLGALGVLLGARKKLPVAAALFSA